MHRFAVASSSSATALLLPPAALGLGAGAGANQALTLVATAAPLRRCGSPPCLARLRSSSMSSSSSSAAAVEEARRGRKQLGMEPPLYDYLLANVREHPVLRELREETASMRGSQMQVSPAQAQLLGMLVQILGAQRCIEVGVYTGYSSLAVTLALPESGRLVACERDERCLEVAKRYYQLAGIAHKVMFQYVAEHAFGVDVKHALAADSLRSLLDCGEASSYDFAFVDADKRMYEEYFELLLKLVRVGGLIVMDNVLWYGRVADPLVNDAKTISIRDFNKKLLEDKRVNISMSVVMERQTLRDIQWLVLFNLAELKEAPRGIEFLLSLQNLMLENMHDEFMEGIQGED